MQIGNRPNCTTHVCKRLFENFLAHLNRQLMSSCIEVSLLICIEILASLRQYKQTSDFFSIYLCLLIINLLFQYKFINLSGFEIKMYRIKIIIKVSLRQKNHIQPNNHNFVWLKAWYLYGFLHSSGMYTWHQRNLYGIYIHMHAHQEQKYEATYFFWPRRHIKTCNTTFWQQLCIKKKQVFK